MIDIFLTIIINAIPLIILIIPLFFIWKKIIGKFYFRIVLGIIIFYFIYWIIPLLLQIGESPTELVTSGDKSEKYLSGIKFLAAHVGSLIASFVFYPLVTLPFIFLVAPFISLLFLFNYLRNEEGTIKENLAQIKYEFNQSPLKKIQTEIIKNDWSREKEILKLMIVLLPISLYLLQVILDISGLQTISLTKGETALGWFIEILLVYLATFIFSIELLSSSRISFKGRYFGEQLRNQTYRSLYTVGAPISILSLILFVVQYAASIFIVIYFLAYFIMVSLIFILFLKVFEPFSILIFIKIIEYSKKKETKPKKIDKSNWYYMLVFSAVAVGVYLLLFSIFNLLFGLFGEEQRVIINSAKYSYKNPSLQNSFRFDLLHIFNIVVLVIIPIFLTIFFFLYGLKYVRNIWFGGFIFFSIIIAFSILMIIIGANPLISFAPEEYWLTGQLSYTDAFGFDFYTFRTAAFDANLFPKDQITLLGILAIPYLFTRYLITLLFWSILIFYIRKEFMIKKIDIDEKRIQRILFTTIDYFISYREYTEAGSKYLITKSDKSSQLNMGIENQNILNLMNLLQQDKFLSEIIPQEEDQKHQLYKDLKQLFFKKNIRLWKPEFSYLFEKVEKQGLYVIYNDGRDVFNYTFIKEHLQDPGLISGMFSAISSFIKETTKSTQLLKTIDHGDITILIEYGSYVFGALFIKGNQTTEIRDQLKDFISIFERKHKEILSDWSGILTPFRQDNLLVTEIFTEE